MPLLFVFLISGLIGGFIAQAKRKNVFLWFVLCGLFPLIGIVVLLMKKGEELYTQNTDNVENRRYIETVPVVKIEKEVKPTFDHLKWNILKDVDPEISAAVQTISGFGKKYEDELAEKYLSLNDKAYLITIVEGIRQKAINEIESFRIKSQELLAEYLFKLKENNGIDDVYKLQVADTGVYDGSAPKFQGGIKVTYVDGSAALIADSREWFRREAELVSFELKYK